MTLTATTNKVSYSGDGSTTAFTVSFVFWNADDLRVILRDANDTETVWTRGTEYTVSGGSGSTGTVTATTAPASGETLVIKSNITDTQDTDIPNGGNLSSSNVEQQLDKIVRMVQQLQEEINRSFRAPETDTASDYEVPIESSRASMLLGFDASGDVTTYAVSSTTIDTMADGTAASPGLSFENDPDSGFFRVGANNMGIALGGSKVFDLLTGAFRGPDGTVAAPAFSFTGDTNTGIYRPGTDAIGIVTGGSEKLLMLSTGEFRVKRGGDSSYNILTVYGASSTVFGSLGISSTAAILSAASGGSDNTNLQFHTAASGNEGEAMRIFSNKDIRLSAGTSALATNSTGGFPGVPTMAGDASGTPANASAGFAPILYDTTNQELKVYDPVATAWRAITTAAQT